MVAAKRREVDERDPFILIESVERPLSTRGKWQLEGAVKALLLSVESGRAVRLRMKEGIPTERIHMALRHALRQKGLQLRYTRSGDDLLAWAEKMRGTIR